MNQGNYQDPYVSLFLTFGQRRIATDRQDVRVLYTDESGNPESHLLDGMIDENDNGRKADFGVEFGDYTGYHFEIKQSWGRGSLRTSTLGIGVGKNFPLLLGRVIFRGVAAVHYGTQRVSLSRMALGPGQTNTRVNGQDFFGDASVNMRARFLELQPRVDLLYRVTNGIQVRAQVGFALPVLTLNQGFLRFSGPNASDESQVARENTDEPNVSIWINSEPSQQRFIDRQLTGLFWGVGIVYNFSHFKYGI